MSDKKNYYYLKLKDNFFDSEEIIILQNMQDGYLYSDILLKLYLRSLKSDGKLLFKDRIPYNPQVLAQVVRHSVGAVEKALQIFKELELVEVLDNGTIFMMDIQNFIGESSSEADRKRLYRKNIDEEKQKLLPEGQMSRQTSDKSMDNPPPEIEIEIEIEKEINILSEDKSSDRVNYQEIIKTYNNICTTLHNVREINQRRKTRLRIMWKENPNLEYFKNIFNTVNKSDFLSGRNNVWTNCNFDWIISPSNITKILEGQYDNKDKHTQQFDFSKCK